MLKGKRIVFAGFNNDDLKNRIESVGGKVTSAVSNLTDVLVAKDLTDIKSTRKVENARTKGAQLISLDDFVAKYMSDNATATAVVQKYREKKGKKMIEAAPQIQPPVSNSKPKAVASKSKNPRMKEIPATLYYIANAENVPPSVDALEALLRLKPSPLETRRHDDLQLHHGDVVIFYGVTKDLVVIIDDGERPRSYVTIKKGFKGLSNDNAIKIPLEVTRSIRDAISCFKRIRYNTLIITLEKNDKTWRKIFIKDSPISRAAEVQYITISRTLHVKYKKWFGDFNIKDVTQEIIETFFNKLESSSNFQHIIPTQKLKHPGVGPFNPYRNYYFEVPIDDRTYTYAVIFSPEYSTFKVAQCKRNRDFDDCERRVVKPMPYLRIWLDDENYEQWRGNVLVQLTSKQYMYIGDKIYTFDVEAGDDIQTFASPAGDGEEPYHYAVSMKNIYLFDIGCYLPISMLPASRKKIDPYMYKKDTNTPGLPRIPNIKTIHSVRK